MSRALGNDIFVLRAYRLYTIECKTCMVLIWWSPLAVVFVLCRCQELLMSTKRCLIFDNVPVIPSEFLTFTRLIVCALPRHIIYNVTMKLLSFPCYMIYLLSNCKQFKYSYQPSFDFKATLPIWMRLVFHLSIIRLKYKLRSFQAFITKA